MPSADTAKTTPAKAATPRKNARDDARRGVAEPQAAWSFRLPCRVTVAAGRDALGRSAKKTMIAIGAAVMAWCFGYTLAYFVDQQEIAKARAMVASVVERIVQVESGGDPNAKNPRSTATGAAQFIDATWLELIR